MTPSAQLPLGSKCAFSALVLVGVVLGLSGAKAQPQERPYRIGVLNNAFAPGSPPVMGLRTGIKAEGLEEGRDVSFDVRSERDDVCALQLAVRVEVGEEPAVVLLSSDSRRVLMLLKLIHRLAEPVNRNETVSSRV
jgi:hypothetical protein